jgi:hypothetical protein
MVDTNKKGLPTFKGKLSGLVVGGVAHGGATYSDWRFKLSARAGAIGTEVWNFIRGAVNAGPPAAALQPKYRDLASTMVDSLQDDALTTAKALPEDQRNARDLLRVLDSAYMSQSISSRMAAVACLVGDVQQEGQSVDAFVAEKRRILREDLQNTVSVQELLLGSITKGLSHDYEDLVGTLVAVDDGDDIDIDEILGKLRDKEKRIVARTEVQTQKAVALKTEKEALVSEILDQIDGKLGAALTTAVQGQFKKVQQTFQKKFGGGGKGGNGGKHGNKNGKNGGKGGKFGKKGKGPKCFNCQQHGHIAKDCPKKKD